MVMLTLLAVKALIWAWCLLLLMPFVWLLALLSRWLLSDRRLRALPWILVAPSMTFALVSFPLWGPSLLDDYQCKSAGTSLSPVDARNEGLYWESHVPDAQAYGNGLRDGDTVLRRRVAKEVFRALVEGRIAFVEIPYEPREAGVDETKRAHQRFVFAREDDRQAECWIGGDARDYGQMHEVRRHLPPGTCIAWELTTGIQSRYRFEGSLSEKNEGHRFAIRDIASGKVVGSHSFGRAERGETLLMHYDIRKLPSPHCTADKVDPTPAGYLPALVFADRNGHVVDKAELALHEAVAWKPVEPAAPTDPVPSGQAGLTYWMDKGALRELSRAEADLWCADMRDAFCRKHGDFGKTYLVTGPIRMPKDLPGTSLLILDRGVPMPTGQRRANSFYRVGDGCLWSPRRCRYD